MPAFLIYELKVAVCLAVFYLFYRILLGREALHRLNRCILVGSVVVSFILPLCVITIHRTVEVEAVFTSSLISDFKQSEDYVQTPMLPIQRLHIDRLGIILTLIYCFGTALVLIKILIELISLKKLEMTGDHHKTDDGYVIIVLDRDIAPFCWSGCIFLSREDYDQNNTHILEHEKAHIRFGHAPEFLVVDVLSALQWFNPAVWLLKQDLRAVYEYEADDAVLRYGADIKEYQYSLIRKAVSASGYSITNSFNHSILKNRITMMSKSKSPRRRGLKVLYVLPLLATALIANARTVNDYKFSENLSDVEKNDNELVFTFKKTSENNWRAVNGTMLYFEGLPVSLDEAMKIFIELSRDNIPVSFILNGEIEDAGEYFKQVRKALTKAVNELNSEIPVEIRKIGNGSCSIFIDDVRICVDDLTDTLSKLILGIEHPVITITADADIRYGIVEDMKNEMRKLDGIRVKYVCNGFLNGSTFNLSQKPNIEKSEAGADVYDFGPVPAGQVYHVKTNADDMVFYNLVDGRIKSFSVNDKESVDVFIGDIGEIISTYGAKGLPYVIAEQQYRSTTFYAFTCIENAIKNAYQRVRNEYSIDRYSKPLAELSVEETEAVLAKFPFRVFELKSKSKQDRNN